jgi:hypothetical protein
MNGDSATRLRATQGVVERAFHFIVVLWGKRYRDYFLEFCLPSMLSPNNIPALRTGRPSKFLIATTPADWESMRATAIFRLMQKYITPVFIEIPSCPPGQSGCVHMGIGHKLACEHAFKERAYAAVVTPDSMLSDGSVARMQELAGAGTRLVLAAALRFGEEPFFDGLRTAGLIPEASARDTGAPVSISSRQMVLAAVNGLHGETLAYEWDGPYCDLVPSASWWRVPGEDGMVVYSRSWAPLLIDYDAVSKHDTSALDNWTIDGDYVYRNIVWREKTYVVQDSDEIFLASWTPMKDGPPPQKPWRILRNRTVRDAVHGAQLRQMEQSFISNPMKREMFFRPVRWHARPLNAKWREVETESMRTLSAYIEPPANAGTAVSPARMQRNVVAIAGVMLQLVQPVLTIKAYRSAIARRLRQALGGDRAALRRVGWHLQRMLYGLAGRPFHRQPPPPPA